MILTSNYLFQLFAVCDTGKLLSVLQIDDLVIFLSASKATRWHALRYQSKSLAFWSEAFDTTKIFAM